MSSSHPLPSPPGQQQHYQENYQESPARPAARQRAKSGFSFHSNHSRKSSGSNKIDLTETSAEKSSKRNTTKADPNMAISEMQPSAVASDEASRLAPIRAIQHRDSHGNAIEDPDRSNPTRSRWERPLDTIRAFEAAIDGNYSRKSYTRADSADSVNINNRRSIHMGGSNNTPRYPQHDIYYGGGGTGRGASRPGSYYGGQNGNAMSGPDGLYEGPQNPSSGYRPDRARYPRTASEPMFNNNNQATGVYPNHGAQPSYETVTTASGSGSSADPVGYQTDPSSDNSSVDRMQAALAAKQEPQETYGFNGFGGGPQIQAPGYNAMNGYGGEQGYNGYPGQNGTAPPSVPRKESIPARAPIRLGTSTAGNEPTVYEAPRPGAGDKRKSWLGRRFSKQK